MRRRRHHRGLQQQKWIQHKAGEEYLEHQSCCAEGAVGEGAIGRKLLDPWVEMRKEALQCTEGDNLLTHLCPIDSGNPGIPNEPPAFGWQGVHEGAVHDHAHGTPGIVMHGCIMHPPKACVHLAEDPCQFLGDGEGECCTLPG